MTTATITGGSGHATLVVCPDAQRRQHAVARIALKPHRSRSQATHHA